MQEWPKTILPLFYQQPKCGIKRFKNRQLEKENVVTHEIATTSKLLIDLQVSFIGSGCKALQDAQTSRLPDSVGTILERPTRDDAVRTGVIGDR